MKKKNICDLPDAVVGSLIKEIYSTTFRKSFDEHSKPLEISAEQVVAVLHAYGLEEHLMQLYIIAAGLTMGASTSLSPQPAVSKHSFVSQVRAFIHSLKRKWVLRELRKQVIYYWILEEHGTIIK